MIVAFSHCSLKECETCALRSATSPGSPVPPAKTVVTARMGKLFMPLIDLLFFWQGPGHCKNAYIKEFERKNYPDEYRNGVPTFESRTKRN